MVLDNDILATLYYIELKSLWPTLILAHKRGPYRRVIG